MICFFPKLYYYVVIPSRALPLLPCVSLTLSLALLRCLALHLNVLSIFFQLPVAFAYPHTEEAASPATPSPALSKATSCLCTLV